MFARTRSYVHKRLVTHAHVYVHAHVQVHAHARTYTHAHTPPPPFLPSSSSTFLPSSLPAFAVICTLNLHLRFCKVSFPSLVYLLIVANVEHGEEKQKRFVYIGWTPPKPYPHFCLCTFFQINRATSIFPDNCIFESGTRGENATSHG